MPRINLHKLILTLTLSFVMLTFMSVLYVSYQEQKNLLVRNTQTADLFYATMLASTADHLIDALQRQLDIQSERIIPHLDNSQQLQEEINYLQFSIKAFNAMQIVNQHGKVLASSSRNITLPSDYAQDAASQLIRKTQQPDVSTSLISTVHHKVINITQPLFDRQQHYLGYMSGIIVLDASSVFYHVLENHKNDNGADIYVIDDSGIILSNHQPGLIGTQAQASPAVTAIQQHQSGVTSFNNLHHQHMLAGYASVARLGWGVIVQRPINAAFTKLFQLVTLTALKTLPILFISFFVIWYLSRQIALPLWKLALLARAIDNPHAQKAYDNINAWYFEAAKLKESMLQGIKRIDTKMNKLDRESVTDPLTGLSNRRGMEKTLAQWSESEYAVLFVDVDHFKKINDTYGHEVGDMVLQTIAAQMRLNFRPHDLLCRIGGEEFLIFMPDTSLDDAFLAAERFRKSIESHPFKDVKKMTVSVGVAHSSHSDSVEELIREADTALYHAKHAGRNSTVLAHSALSDIPDDHQ